MGFKDVCPSVPQNSVWDATCHGFFVGHENTTLSNNAYEHSDFQTVGENICRSGTAISGLTGRNKEGEVEG